MSAEIITIIMFALLLIMIFLGHPLAFTLGSIATLFGLIGWGWDFGIVSNLFITKTYGIITNYVLVAIPLFIFMAQVLDASGIAEKLFKTMYVVVGVIPGGLAIATIIVCTVFASSTGIVGAVEVAMGLLAGPALLKRGYDPKLVAGSICGGGTLGILIPPSIMLVVYGGMQGISVGKLFAAAMLPGLLLAGSYVVYIFIRSVINPEMAPPISKEERMKYTFAEKLKMTAESLIPPVVLVVLVLGSIIAGVATPTEAAGMGSIGAMILAAAYKKLTWNVLKDSAISTIKTTCMVMVLFIGGNCFSAVFMGLGGGDTLASLLLNISANKYVVLAIMQVGLVILGMFIDWLGILLICVPVFTPVAMELGFDPLWFATLICVNLQMSFLTPPFGYSLFYLKGVNLEGMTMIDIYKGVVPFVMIQATTVIACVIWPDVILYLPRVIFGQ